MLVSLDSVDRVSVSYEDTMHVLEKDGYQIDGKEAGQERFQEYYGTLLDIPLTGAAEEISREEKEPVLVIRYDRTDEEATDIEVCFYPYDDDNLSVSVNGCEAFLADREAVETVMGSDPLRET